VMNRKVSCLALVSMLLALSFPAEAQQQSKLFKIGYLTNGPNRTLDNNKKALRALGYIEGKNIVIEYRFSEGKLDRFPALAEKLVRLKVDLIVAIGTSPAQAAKNATKTIPIVFTSGGDPVTVGLVDSLAHPAGNLTGFSNITSELVGKRLELLK